MHQVVLSLAYGAPVIQLVGLGVREKDGNGLRFRELSHGRTSVPWLPHTRPFHVLGVLDACYRGVTTGPERYCIHTCTPKRQHASRGNA